MKRLTALLLLLLLLLPAGCAPADDTPEGISLWFISVGEDGSIALSGQTFTGPKQISPVMNALLAGPTQEGLISPIPPGTTVQDRILSGSILHLDLSREYAALTGVDLTLANYCIALTLTGLDSVEGVSISVNGSARSGILRREDVLFSGAEEDPVELSAALCFLRSGGNELGVELRVFRLTENESAAMAVVEALIAGPGEAGLEPLLPPELEIYSARVEAGICYPDFSAALLAHVPDSEEAQKLVVRSITESLRSLGYVQAVQILVEGEPLTRYGSVDLTQPAD